MPDGIVQWYDATAGEAALVKAGRVFRAQARELAPEARHPGARVHFDVQREGGVDRAVHVTLRAGTRTARRQRRFGDLAGARRPDTKGGAPSARPHPERGRALAAHPLEVARSWARALGSRDLDTALALCAPDAVLHVDGDALAGRSHLLGYLEASPLFGIDHDPVIRGAGGVAILRWDETDRSPSLEVRCRVAHGQIAELWLGMAEPEGPMVTVATTAGPLPMAIVTRGEVRDDAPPYAHQRIGTVIEHIEDPVLFARVKLTQAADPARERPAIAQVSLDLDGDLVRAHVSAHDMRAAIDLLQARLRDKLQHRAQHREAVRQRPGASRPGEWRHGDPPTLRPEHFDRPVEEREVVRHKAYAIDDLTPDEAAFDLEQIDADFYLFRDLATGEDALLERAGLEAYRLTRLHPAAVDTGPTAVAVELVEAPVPRLRLEQAMDRLATTGERWLFFADADSGRGNVLYRRYDGHYGWIAPE